MLLPPTRVQNAYAHSKTIFPLGTRQLSTIPRCDTWEAQQKRGSLAGGAVAADRAAESLRDDVADDVQPQPRTPALRRVVKKGSKMRGRCRFEMPCPSSAKRNSTISPAARTTVMTFRRSTGDCHHQARTPETGEKASRNKRTRVRLWRYRQSSSVRAGEGVAASAPWRVNQGPSRRVQAVRAPCPNRAQDQNHPNGFITTGLSPRGEA